MAAAEASTFYSLRCDPESTFGWSVGAAVHKAEKGQAGAAIGHPYPPRLIVIFSWPADARNEDRAVDVIVDDHHVALHAVVHEPVLAAGDHEQHGRILTDERARELDVGSFSVTVDARRPPAGASAHRKRKFNCSAGTPAPFSWM